MSRLGNHCTADSIMSNRIVTIDGYDAEAQPPLTVDTIHLWEDYEPNLRGRVVAKVPHGTEVELIERQGNGVLVEYKGKQGWCTYWFIKEFK